MIFSVFVAFMLHCKYHLHLIISNSAGDIVSTLIHNRTMLQQHCLIREKQTHSKNARQTKKRSILSYNFAISGVNVLLVFSNKQQTKNQYVELNFISFCILYQAFFYCSSVAGIKEIHCIVLNKNKKKDHICTWQMHLQKTKKQSNFIS